MIALQLIDLRALIKISHATINQKISFWLCIFTTWVPSCVSPLYVGLPTSCSPVVPQYTHACHLLIFDLADLVCLDSLYMVVLGSHSLVKQQCIIILVILNFQKASVASQTHICFSRTLLSLHKKHAGHIATETVSNEVLLRILTIL